MSAAHTATPWAVEDIGANVLLIKSRAVPVNESASSTERDYYSRIASVTQRDPHPRHNGGISMANCKANAEFIVRACNAHGALVEELSRALPFLEDMLDDPAYKNSAVAERIKKASAALSKAQGA